MGSRRRGQPRRNVAALIKVKPGQRNAANARERARMRVLSRAFCRLKTSLPWVPPDTKLSKLDTLKLASTYIGHLRQILQNENAGKTQSPIVLSWPFGYQNKLPYSSTSGNNNNNNNNRVDQQFICPESESRSCTPDGDFRNYAPCEYTSIANSQANSNYTNYSQFLR